jgi:hypothetical protein
VGGGGGGGGGAGGSSLLTCMRSCCLCHKYILYLYLYLYLPAPLHPAFVQVRLIAVVIMFPSVFRMTMTSFVLAAAVPLIVVIAMLVVARGAPSTMYFFSVVLLVFSFTAYVLLRGRRSSAEVRATSAKLAAENATLHALLTRRACCARGCLRVRTRVGV